MRKEVSNLRNKRAVALKKRRQQQRIHMLLACLITGIMVLLVIHFSNRVNANDMEVQRTKYYTGIQVEEGDSLWSIAKEYISEEYDDIQEYIDEVKRVNQLKSDRIYVGKYLIIPYYE